MYENPGEKLMSVASTVTGIGMFLSVVAGFACFFIGSVGFVLGIVVMVVGCLGCWLSNLVIATFAQIAIDVHKMAEANSAPQTAKQPATNETQKTPTVEPESGWVCAGCGLKNSWHVYSCQGCGVSKGWSENQKK